MDVLYIIENIVPRGNERIGYLFQTYGRQNEFYNRELIETAPACLFF